MTRKLLGLVVIAAAMAMTHSRDASAQEDILGMASNLTSKSSELQKVQDELKSQRQEVKKEAEALEVEAKKVDAMKAAAASNNDPGPLAGPFYLFTGAYSNNQASRGGGESEAFGGPAQGGEKFESLAEVHAKAMKHMSGSNQPSFRIEDKNGKNIESAGVFSQNLLSDARIANPSGPKPDSSALDAASGAGGQAGCRRQGHAKVPGRQG